MGTLLSRVSPSLLSLSTARVGHKLANVSRNEVEEEYPSSKKNRNTRHYVPTIHSAAFRLYAKLAKDPFVVVNICLPKTKRATAATPSIADEN